MKNKSNDTFHIELMQLHDIIHRHGTNAANSIHAHNIFQGANKLVGWLVLENLLAIEIDTIHTRHTCVYIVQSRLLRLRRIIVYMVHVLLNVALPSNYSLLLCISVQITHLMCNSSSFFFF